MIKTFFCSLLLGTLLLLTSPIPAQADQTPVPTIEAGRTVSIEYTLTLDNGQTADTNVGGEPLVYQQGGGQILPALEQALQGLRVNARKTVTLPPEQGYGVVEPEGFQPVPIDLIPEEARNVGEQLVLEGPDQQKIPARVHDIKEDQIVLNLNHPLAGETLTFDIRILDIQ